MDPRRTVILVRPPKGGEHVDRTHSVLSIRREGAAIVIQFKNASKPMWYKDARGGALWLSLVEAIPVEDGVVVLVRGMRVHGATEVRYFSNGVQSRVRVFRRKKNGEQWYDLCLPEEVRMVPSALREPGASEALAHWRSIVSLLGDGSLTYPYEHLDFVHPESALARYIGAAAPVPEQPAAEPPEIVVPFNSNLSQHEALRRALDSPVSVIEGPPGTGKTETILNIIANIVRTPGLSVGIVSLTNAAVENVRDKLEQAGIGFIAADLRRKSKRQEYFDAQPETVRRIEDFLRIPLPSPPADGEIGALDARLNHLLGISRSLAHDRDELAALELEKKHFTLLAEQHRIAELDNLPLLRKSSGRILDYLVEHGSPVPDENLPRRIIRTIRHYFRYGSTGHINPDESAVLLGLQRAWYDARTAEARARIASAESELERSDFDALQKRRTELSRIVLRHAIHARYHARRPRVFKASTYRHDEQFPAFIDQHPVVLSTCHSIRPSLRDGFLLDYLIVDESSQVGLLPAVLALSCARRVVVVGDLKQLPEIPPKVPRGDSIAPPPSPVYDAREHNLLSSVITAFGDALPRTMLREHYRCDPAIIGFCNAMFYDGLLIPMTAGRSGEGDDPLRLVRLVEGAHMRHHRGGGNTNQREADVIAREVLAELPDEQRDGDHVVVITPFRKQVDKITMTIADQARTQIERVGRIEADTVHKIQGRDKDVVILSCVVDDSRAGHIATPFADDANLVNVAVSRARSRFILVIDHSFLPRSRNLSGLAGWISYHRPDREYTQSRVVSVFDLLYREYSDRLRDFQSRISRRSRYESENIMWTLLDDVLAEEDYSRLHLAGQVLLKNVLGSAAELTERERAYVRHRSSFDFVISDGVTKEILLAIEVDGFASHENSPEQAERDALKNAICERNGLNLLRLPTTGSNEAARVRRALDRSLAGGVVLDLGTR